MARTTLGIALALVVALLATGQASAARPCHKSNDRVGNDVLQSLPAAIELSSEGLPPMELAHHGCTSTCNNDDTPKELNIECWGTYMLVCRGNSSIMATKCEGHYIGAHILDRHMYVGVCEGLVHKFAHWTSRCPKTGASKTRFFARGCLGGSASSIKVHNDSSPDFRTVAEALAPSGTITVPSVPQLDALDAELPKPYLSSGNGVVHESRCKGRGGEVVGVKWGNQQDALAQQGTPQEVFDALRDAVTASAGSLPKDLLDLDLAAGNPAIAMAEPEHGISQHGSLLAAMVGMVHDDPHPSHPSCTLTCNGRTTWLHGMWPCYGVLEVSCSTADAAPGARTMSFSGSCKGLWTGALGKMCWGLTQQHTDKTWPTGSAKTDAICSGYKGIWSHRKGDANSGAFAMGQWCKGAAVSHAAYGWHDADRGATMVA